MYFSRWQLSLALLLALGQANVAAMPPKTMGYLGWWLPRSWDSLALAQFDRLFFFELRVDASGAISEKHGWPEQWTAQQMTIHAAKVPLDLTLTLFEPGHFNTLFRSEAAMDRLRNECLELVKHPSISGLHIDFEIFVDADSHAIANFRQFLISLSDHLHQLDPQKKLSVFMPFETTAELYDRVALDKLDFVVMQAYDTHQKDSQHAGPVAPISGPDTLTWEKVAAKGAALGLPGERLVLTFPLYGYEWQVTKHQPRAAVKAPGTTTSFAPLSADELPDIRISVTQRVRQYGATHDPLTGSSYYQFTLDKQFYQGWFEDWWSLDRKIDFLNQQKLGGIAFFLLGYDNQVLVNHYLNRQPAKNFENLIDQLQNSGTEFVR